MSETLRAAVVGGSGYTGAELCRLIHGHPHLELGPVIGNSRAGEPLAKVLPSLAGYYPGREVESFDAAAVAQSADLAFCALPHGASAGIVSELRDQGLVVFDLSADFRLDDPATYAEWYGEHRAPARFSEGTYGLVEWYRAELRAADLVAVPGCFPTSAVLALAPIVAAGLVEPAGLIVDSKSGVSGAGRKHSLATHLPESSEGIRAYKAAGQHRHTAEMDQELAKVAGAPLQVLFTPHLTPMTRGILSTCYALATEGSDAVRCTEVARAKYAGSPSVVVLDPGTHPDTLWVRGSNRVHIAYHHDTRTDRIVAFGAIDNLVKGAAGQAIQCANVRFGFEEGAGIDMPAHWP